MAFVRYKTVKGKKYYQWVRNYRDNGKHKQEVLYHFGPQITSPEEAIAEEKENVRYRRKGASDYRKKAQNLKVELSSVFGQEGIPDIDAALDRRSALDRYEYYFSYFVGDEDYYVSWSDYEEWAYSIRSLSQPPPYHDHYQRGEFDLWEQECRADQRLHSKVIEYHYAPRNAERQDYLANEHQAKLDKLLELQQAYGKG